MKRIHKLLIPLFCISLFSLASCEKKEGDKAAATKFLTIGTGGVTGVYYPAGQSISKMVNKKSDTYNIKATAESTGGSVFNVNALMAGDIEAGVVQSDRGYQAWNGTADWKDKGKQPKLRSMFSLYPETVTLIAAVDSGINGCKDLKGKRIAVGNPGSGTRQNAMDALSTCGLTFDDITPEGLKASEGAKMLQDGRIDGFFFTAGHPSGSIKEAVAGRRKLKFVPFENASMLTAKFPYYTQEKIPVSYYPGIQNESDVTTFAVKATILTSSDVPTDSVYAVTKEVFTNLEEFKKLHPAFTYLEKEKMMEGLTAPLHEGAVKYFKEAGLMK